MGLKLTIWSNNKDNTKEELKELGHKIVGANRDGAGHIIRYIHSTLTIPPGKGDLVEFIDYKDDKKKRGIIKATGDDWWCVKGCVGLKKSIVCIGRVTRIIKIQMIPEKVFKYL